MSIDALFDQPDIDRDAENRPDYDLVPTYTATATKTEKGWSVTVPGLPGERTAHAEGRTWREAQDNAFTAVQQLLGDDTPDVFGIAMAPSDPEAAAAIGALVAARARLVYAEQEIRDAARNAAQILTAKGYTTRDAGAAMGVSHQRVSQLAPATA